MKPWHANLLHRIFLKHYIAMRTTVTAFADPHVRQRWRAVDAPQSDKAAHAGAAFVLCDFFLPAFNYACGLLASLMSSRPVAARVARDPNFLDQLAFAGASMVAIKAAPGFHGRPELPIGWYTCSDILNAVDICSLAVAENRNPWHQTSHGAVIMGQHVPAELLYINAGAINGVFEQGASHPGTDPSRGPRFAARRLILSLVVERDVEKNPVLSLRREALKACIAARLPGDDACDACYKPGPLSTVCGNCGFGTFCSGDCLRAGFEDHKTVCKQIGMGMIRSMQELRAKQLEHRKLMPKKR
ncbi:hypothetical protein DFJ74DRAFT_650270 [Hyaloraphidium curvatum]|nr:hypothetical protein DFJ74DRAFT_650270 [Hyaloraphidium curvatum]